MGTLRQVVPGGPGSNYLASLKVGDTFKAFAPYGDFMYDSASGRDACFISTGTGVAPSCDDPFECLSRQSSAALD